MATLAFLVAALLDPVQAALVLALMLAYRGPQPVLVAAAATAAISETVTVMAGIDYSWGEMLAPRLTAALVQAGALWWLMKLVRQALSGARPATSAAQLTSEAPPPSGTFTAEQVGQRSAAWEMRAYIRRHVQRLLTR